MDILNAEVFAESLQHAGFKLKRIIKREIPLKILPQKRDEKTGRFASKDKADSEAYPTEYIVIGLKGVIAMQFEDLQGLYITKKNQLGANANTRISELLEEAKEYHKRDWDEESDPWW